MNKQSLPFAFAKGNNYITASEIGEYVYCPRGWWLKTKGAGQTTPQMLTGLTHHESLLARINWSPRLQIIALLLIAIAGMIILLIIRSIFT